MAAILLDSINWWVSFTFLYEYGAPLGGRQSLLQKFSLAVRLRGHKQTTMFIHFFCLCLLGHTIKLKFNISKVAY